MIDNETILILGGCGGPNAVSIPAGGSTGVNCTRSPGCWTGETGDSTGYLGGILSCRYGHLPSRFSRETAWLLLELL